MKKVTLLVIAAALVAAGFAQSFAVIAGSLMANHYRDHAYRLTPGKWRVDLVDLRGNDLDVEVYNSQGLLVDSDTLPDSNPVVEFYVNRSQVYTIRVINQDIDSSARYTGTIE